jgi:DNA polymerase-1
MGKTIFLIDGTHQVFRSFFAIKSQLVSRGGVPTNAIYGFTRMLKKLLSDRNPEYIAVAFDMAAPTFRHEAYEEYKANRPEAPDDLVVQLPYIRKICTSYGVQVIEKEGYEADDIIGTIAERAKQEGFSVIIVASDKDLYQLVEENVTMLNIHKDNLRIGEKEVKQIFGVTPEQVVDVFALWGDPTDNISGVPGIGEKSAKEMITQYDSLENVLERGHRFIDFIDWKGQFLHIIERIGKEKARKDKALFGKFFRQCEQLETRAEALFALEKDATIKKNLQDLIFHLKILLDQKDDFMQKPEKALSELKKLKGKLKGIEKGTSLKSWKSLVENKDSAFLSRKLASIEKKVPIKIDLESYHYRGPDRGSLNNIFMELDFTSLVDVEDPKPARGSEPIPFQRISQKKEFIEALKKVEHKGETILSFRELPESRDQKKKDLLAFLIPSENRVYGLSIASDRRSEKELSFFKSIKDVLEKEEIKKIGYDLKEIKKAFKKRKIDLQGLFFDVMIASYLLDPARRDFSFSTILREAHKKKGSKYGSGKEPSDALSEENLLQQCVQQAQDTAEMYSILNEKLVRENLEELYEEIEIPLIDVLSDMEMTGIRLDGRLLKSMSRTLETEMNKLQEEIFRFAGEEFNINSPKQLGDILFNKIGLTPSKKTPRSRDFATGMEILEELSKAHPLPKKILEYRSMAKIKSTYTDALPPMVHSETGRIHTTFNQTGTATGRLSSSEPNLQNIPIGGELGKKIRSAFIPERGKLFLSADYSQIELRILAHLSDDPDLMEAFHRGEDIHRTTTSRILLIPYEKVSEQQRRFAKAINFGIIYGMGAFRLAKELGISRVEAQKFIDSYFHRFRRVKEYIDETTRFVEKHGYITTLFNRVRYFKEIKSSNRMIVQQAIRQAVNTTIQGTAADLIKKAMISIHREMENASFKMILQVHDELLFEVPEAKAKALIPWIKDKMENVYKLKVPLVVHIGVGKNWAEAKPS